MPKIVRLPAEQFGKKMNDGFVGKKFVPIKCLLGSMCALFMVGCGTTKWSDTARTGTEQLLVSNAIDRVVANIDFSPMHHKKCFLNTTAIQQTTDREYLSMTIRQHLVVAGVILVPVETEADYIIEVRAGAVGTDRDDVLVGIPATTLPSIPTMEFSATSIPEISIMKRTKQRGVAKVALFAYNRETGQPVWASGNSQGESTARNLWFVGTGPLTRGTIYQETTFAGNPVPFWSGASADSKMEKSQVFSEPVSVPGVSIPAPVNPFPPVSGVSPASY